MSAPVNKDKLAFFYGLRIKIAKQMDFELKDLFKGENKPLNAYFNWVSWQIFVLKTVVFWAELSGAFFSYNVYHFH